MLNRLHYKLLLPLLIVGAIAIICTLLFIDNLGQGELVLFLLVVILIQAVASSIFTSKQLSVRISRLKNYLDLVVSTEEAPSKPISDGIHDDLGGVINELGEFINNLSDVIAEIRTESEMLKQGSQHLTTQMTTSVSSVDNSSSQIEQMAESIASVASTSSILSENAIKVSTTTEQVVEILEQGANSSSTSQNTIESFVKEINLMADDLGLLQEECSRIGSVLDVIRGIADQTNLLALNAAIEAARAGEQGRGFAVVADEVRALAHRTQESTVEIQSMVEGLQEKSTNAVNAISRGQELTQSSLSQSEEVVDALNKIGDVFSEVDNLTSQIAQGTEEQQSSTASINDNMSSVVALSRDINEGLAVIAQHAEQQHETSLQVDVTLNRICV